MSAVKFSAQHTVVRCETPRGVSAFQVAHPEVLVDDRAVAATYMKQVCKDTGMPFEDGMAGDLQAYLAGWLGSGASGG